MVFGLAFSEFICQPKMADLEFWSDDHRFGLRILDKEVSQIVKICVRFNVEEVGGVLVGFYTAAHDCAEVKAVSEPPPDSRGSRTWFHRGVGGLQAWLDRLWYEVHHYYLGEWHFHPHGSPIPSTIDIRQLKETANSSRYKCPEPVLLIIGGDPAAEWIAAAYVFPRGGEPIELARTDEAMP
jgi:integrative and conjugative element protein (TIGR02256 family)